MSSIPCQGRTSRGGECGNKSSEQFCFQHRYQSKANQSGKTRLLNAKPTLSSQPNLSLFDDIDSLEGDSQPVISRSPKGYDNKADTMPRYAIFRGRKVQVISYEENNRFLVLDTDDSYRTVHRDNMTMLSNKLKRRTNDKII